MTLPPVTHERIEIATRTGIRNASTAAMACREAGLPYYASCALLEIESWGRNIYGHDKGGVFSNDEHPIVNEKNFFQFIMRVMNGAVSNGVGPCQITYAGALKDGHRDGGYFRLMAAQGLRPWSIYENEVFGFGILAGHFKRTKSWVKAGRLYNGSEGYGIKLDLKVSEWKKRLKI